MTHNVVAKSKNTPRRAATLQRLFEAAREVFVERGLNGASVEDICSRAGFTRGAFYSNFKSKDELFIALVKHENERTIDSYKTLIETYKNAEESTHLETFEDIHALAAQVLLPYRTRLSTMVLELEFQLLAVRTSKYYEKVKEIYDVLLESISTLTTELLKAVGRRFTVSPLVASAAFVSAYQRSVLSSLTIINNQNE
ncbi:MAG: TetR/AcrR family transcriptional regulator, partial [Arcanobacterium sp.]|nr:TetR/AcrR family transcriptional regulator [Arcanobacterium sp.]